MEDLTKNLNIVEFNNLKLDIEKILKIADITENQLSEIRNSITIQIDKIKQHITEIQESARLNGNKLFRLKQKSIKL